MGLKQLFEIIFKKRKKYTTIPENKSIVEETTITETISEENTEKKVRDIHIFSKVRPGLKFGDIIYANHYYNEETRKTMKYPCETGPYVVIGFDGDKIIGVPCIFAEYHGDIILGENYKVFKGKRKGYIAFNRIRAIDESTFVSLFKGKLNNKDITKIRKRLVLNGNRKYDDFGEFKEYKHNFNDKFNVGDFVGNTEYRINGMLIDRINSDTFVFLPLENHNRRSSNINFEIEDIDYSKVIEINTNNMTYCNTINQPQVTKMIQKYNEYKAIKGLIKEDGNKTVTKGNIVYFKDAIYYVYEITGSIANAYKVVLDESEYSFKIDNLSCRPMNKQTIQFSLKDDYHIIAKANNYEMDNIKDIKVPESNQTDVISKIVTSKKSYYPKGLIMSKISDSTKEYIVRDQLYGTYRVISVKELINDKKIKGELVPIKELRELEDVSPDIIDSITSSLDELGEVELSNEIKNRVLK